MPKEVDELDTMKDHSINAYSIDTPAGQMRVLECSCGFTARTAWWEDSGDLMDQHLKEVLKSWTKVVAQQLDSEGKEGV
jgi:hypothetical protein